jgi:hypothetical protein
MHAAIISVCNTPEAHGVQQALRMPPTITIAALILKLKLVPDRRTNTAAQRTSRSIRNQVAVSAHAELTGEWDWLFVKQSNRSKGRWLARNPWLKNHVARD